MLVDSHVNLHAHQFDEDRDAVIARARAAGVGLMLTICDKMENFAAVRAIADAHADVYCSVGAHPHYASSHRDLSAESLVAAAQTSAKVAALGETGLDLYYKHSPLNDQIAVFRAHIEAARRLNLPVIIHTRDADEETGAILEEEMRRAPFAFLLHCYTSGLDLARRGMELGGFISFSGILSFKNADAVREVARAAPLERILIETDCPYLAPAPHRGRRCEPAYAVDVLRCLAQVRGISEEAARASTNAAFFSLFRAIERPAWLSTAAEPA